MNQTCLNLSFYDPIILLFNQMQSSTIQSLKNLLNLWIVIAKGIQMDFGISSYAICNSYVVGYISFAPLDCTSSFPPRCASSSS